MNGQIHFIPRKDDDTKLTEEDQVRLAMDAARLFQVPICVLFQERDKLVSQSLFYECLTSEMENWAKAYGDKMLFLSCMKDGVLGNEYLQKQSSQAPQWKCPLVMILHLVQSGTGVVGGEYKMKSKISMSREAKDDMYFKRETAEPTIAMNFKPLIGGFFNENKMFEGAGSGGDQVNPNQI